MTPADEATFINMWNQGASYRELAAALRCPLGTVASRAASLAAQGKIQPRQRGGAYPSRRTKVRPDGPPAPVQRPVQLTDTGAVSSVATGAVQTVATGAVQAISTEVEQLKADVHGLHLIVQSVVDRLDHPPVQHTWPRPPLHGWGIALTRDRSPQGVRAPERLSRGFSHLLLLDLFPGIDVGVVRGGRGDLVSFEDQCARLERQRELEAPRVRRDGDPLCLAGEVVDGVFVARLVGAETEEERLGILRGRQRIG